MPTESVRAIDDTIITIRRESEHVYQFLIQINSLDVSFLLTTDNIANLADALLVISEADRATRMAERKQKGE